MAIKFTTTQTVVHKVKVVVYGASGVGKTTLAKTCPKPIIISSEHRLLSLSDANIPVIMIEDHEDLEAAFDFINGPKGKRFETIVVDSISDIAETILAHFKENPEDGNRHKQAAYGSLADSLQPLIKRLRDIKGKHVYIIAKQKLMHDEYNGITMYSPSLPGQVLPQALPYMFDFVLPLRIGETESGKKYRYLQTEEDMQYLAKACSGNLSKIERPHLGKLFDKILESANMDKSGTAEDKKTKKQAKPKTTKKTEKGTADGEVSEEKTEKPEPTETGKSQEGNTGTNENDDVKTGTGSNEGQDGEVSGTDYFNDEN